jgi:hypothetical protein
METFAKAEMVKRGPSAEAKHCSKVQRQSAQAKHSGKAL